MKNPNQPIKSDYLFIYLCFNIIIIIIILNVFVYSFFFLGGGGGGWWACFKAARVGIVCEVKQKGVER